MLTCSGSKTLITFTGHGLSTNVTLWMQSGTVLSTLSPANRTLANRSVPHHHPVNLSKSAATVIILFRSFCVTCLARSTSVRHFVSPYPHGATVMEISLTYPLLINSNNLDMLAYHSKMFETASYSTTAKIRSSHVNYLF